MTITDELVEALARNIFDLEDGSRWDQTTEGMRDAYRVSIRRALEAIAEATS